MKREVIIVITPSVLPDESPVHASMPKDVDLFDKFGNRLFRDAYRIRAEDTFDLRYLTENKGLRQLQEVVDRIVNDHPQLTKQYPYQRFADQAVPGEDALVRRQIYEVLKRQKAAEVLDVEKLIFFERKRRAVRAFECVFCPITSRNSHPLSLRERNRESGWSLLSDAP